MPKSTRFTGYTSTVFAVGLLSVHPALSDKPPWAGVGEKGKPAETRPAPQAKYGGQPRVAREGRYFADPHRATIRGYYDAQYHAGRCPPGLTKKVNGCMPPGQAKKWQIGRPLPRDVIFYDAPPALVVQLGAPPAGHKYVRVAADILLIAVGTGMVIDAIEDWGRM